MRIYVDLNCFNRPFDDQGQERVRREAEAVLSILSRVVEGRDALVWSDVLSFENRHHPLPDRREEIARWRSRAAEVVDFSEEVEKRARELHVRGIAALDAAHLASAGFGRAEAFLTCDDRLIRQAGRVRLGFRVVNPIEFLREAGENG